MSGPVVLRILLLAAEALAASTALPALAWAACLTFDKRANMRHLVRTVMFAALLALPVLTVMTPALLIFHHSAAREEVQALTLPMPVPAGRPADDQALVLDGATLLVGGLAVWGLGVAVMAGQSLLAALGLASLRRRAVLHSYAEMPRIGRPWELRVCGLCTGPMTWGVLRPVVLLPWEARHWPRARMDAVLAHELAHVRRWDCLAQAIATAACALYWPNPLVWLAAKALRRDAEVAADDAVIASGVRPSDYAETLVSLARAARSSRLALAMANPTALADRVQSILSPTPVRTGVTPMDALKIVGAGAVATAAIALAHPGIAETPAAAAPTAAPPVVQQRLADPAPVAKTPAPSVTSAVRQRAIEPPRGAGATADTVPQAVNAAEIGADVRKAIAEAHISETVAKALADEQAKTRGNPQLTRWMADLQPRIEKAIAEAHMEEQVAEHLADLQPRIDAATAMANAAAAKAQAKAEAAQDAAAKARDQQQP